METELVVRALELICKMFMLIHHFRFSKIKMTALTRLMSGWVWRPRIERRPIVLHLKMVYKYLIWVSLF